MYVLFSDAYFCWASEDYKNNKILIQYQELKEKELLQKSFFLIPDAQSLWAIEMKKKIRNIQKRT